MLRKLSAVFLLILTSLGFIAGNVNAAKSTLAKIVRAYPGTDVARDAQTRLKDMK